MRVGLIGAGKRMTNIYAPLLRRANEDIVGFVTRTQATADTFSAKTGIKQKATIAELVAERPDYLIVCVAPNAVSSCLKPLLTLALPILIETPIEDFMLLETVERHGTRVGVLEQWPYLPLEQFKEMLYRKKLISRPYLVKNDCRSYDYHAVAQLRTYLGRTKADGSDIVPVKATASRLAANLSAFTDSDGSTKNLIDAWDLGQIEFDTGAVLCHEFSYACKVAPFRSIQTLRAYSADGTIVTGRIFDRNDDCEIIDVEFIRDGRPQRLDVSVVRNPAGAIASITADGFEWRCLHDSIVDDNESAILAHIVHMRDVQLGAKPLYPLKDAVLDQYLVLAMKEAAQRSTVLKLGTR